MFEREAEKYNVFPLDDRVTERENPEVAGRLDLHLGRTTLTFGPRVGRLTEEAAPNVKNRSHVITADIEVGRPAPTAWWSRRAAGSAGGRCTASTACPRYAYNFVGRDLTIVRGNRGR